MFDPLLSYVRLQLSDSLSNQAPNPATVVNGGTVFIDQPGRFKTNGLLFTGLTTGTLTVEEGMGIVPGADVEATVEGFFRPSSLGGNDQVVAVMDTAYGSVVRVVIRGGRYRLEVAERFDSPRWVTFAGLGPEVVWDEWQFLAVVAEVDPVRKYSLYVGTSGTATLAGEVADPEVFWRGYGGPVSPRLRLAAWPAGMSLRTFHTSSALTGTGARIVLGCEYPEGTNISILANGVEVGGTVGAGQTLTAFLQDVVRPAMLTALAGVGTSQTISVAPISTALGNTVGNVNNWAELVLMIGGTISALTVVVAPVGVQPVRFRGNVSELRITSVRRRYFDPFSTPANQPVVIPTTSWDGGGEMNVAASIPKPLATASASPGTTAAMNMPKLALTATVTQGGTTVGPGPTETGTSLVLRSPSTATATVEGVAYAWPFSFGEPNADEIAIASMSRSTGRWYFEVTSLHWFTVGVVAGTEATSAGADIGYGMSFGYGVDPFADSANIVGGGTTLANVLRPDPNGSFGTPVVGTVGVLFDADTKTFLTFQESAPGVHGPSQSGGIPLALMDMSFMTGGMFPAVRVARDVAVGFGGSAELTVNFGTSMFAFPDVLTTYEALPYDSRPLVSVPVGAQVSATVPKIVSAGAFGAHVGGLLPKLFASSTAEEIRLTEASLSMPAATLQARSGHSAAVSAPALTVSAAGTVVAVAQVVGSLPAMRVVADGRVSDQAVAYLRLRVLTGSVHGGGHAAGPLPVMSGVALATTGGVANLRGVLRRLVIRAEGFREETARALLTLPMLEARHPAQATLVAPAMHLSSVVSEVFDTASTESYVLNLRRPLDANPRNQYEAKNPQATRYTGFPFTRVVRFMGEYYGVAADGLYRIGGDTDAGEPVAWDFKTCSTDFGDTHKKNVHSVYVGGTLPGTVAFSIHSGESVEQTHEARSLKTDVSKNYRQTFGRGRQERYYAFGFAGAGLLSVDTIEFTFATSSRRI